MRLRFDYSIGLTLLGLTAFSAIALTLPTVQAEGTEFVDSTSITVPISCSVTSSGTESHNAEVNNGQTISDIGTTSIKVFCNDSTGYALYAIGYTDDEYGNNVLSSSLSSDYDIATSSTINTITSSWAMKLTKTGSYFLPIIAGSSTDTNKQSGDPDFSGYTAVPATYAKVAYFPTSTDVGASANGSNLTTTYRAYISSSQPAGAYAGQVKYTLVHPSTVGKPVPPLKEADCPAGYVCYAQNASDIIGSMSSLGSITSSPTAGKTNVGTSATTINLIAPNYKREGYGFAGWSTDFTATSSSTIYGPNETITVPSNTLATKGMILYPVWVASAGNLQDWTGCSSLTTAPSDGTRATLASMTALTDTRDNNVYTVARLADGKCWMTENLRLDSENSIGAENIAKAQGYGDATSSAQGNLGKFIGLANSEDANFTNSITANSLYSIDGSNGTININSNNPGYRIPRYNKNNTNMATNATNSNGTTTLTDSCNASNNHVRWYGYGNYYNWPAAIADTAYYNQNNVSVTTTSICPAGWRLPVGGKITVDITGDFYVLTKTLMGGTEPNTENTNGYGYYDGTVDGVDLGATASKALRAYPNNIVYSGYFDGSSAIYRGSYGGYWSSSMGYNGNGYNLYLYTSRVYPGTSHYNRNNGFSIRCISQ